MSALRRRWPLALVVGALLWATPFVASAVPAPAATAAEDIRDIRGPIAIPPWWRWLAVGAGAIVLVAAGAVTATLVRRRRQRPLAPHERALARLAEARPLAEAGQADQYATAASDAVREYIEERFGVPATHATTEEFFEELVTHPSPQIGAHRAPLMQFLCACDLAKFARFPLAAEGMSSLDELARTFVLATAPSASGAAAAERMS